MIYTCIIHQQTQNSKKNILKLKHSQNNKSKRWTISVVTGGDEQ